MTISITKIEHFELINDSANPKPQSFTPYDHKMASFPLSHHWYNRALTSPKFYWKQLRFGRFKIFRTPDVQSLVRVDSNSAPTRVLELIHRTTNQPRAAQGRRSEPANQAAPIRICLNFSATVSSGNFYETNQKIWGEFTNFDREFYFF